MHIVTFSFRVKHTPHGIYLSLTADALSSLLSPCFECEGEEVGDYLASYGGPTSPLYRCGQLCHPTAQLLPGPQDRYACGERDSLYPQGDQVR